jgi:hypothetical protein
MFAMQRESEFFQVRSLHAQTGQPVGNFASVVIKELLDNALDAAEASGRQPLVSLTVVDDETGCLAITVTDNGSGFSLELVDLMLDFSVLVSDKAAYRSPTRGLQGNAMKTIIGIPTALGTSVPRVIESSGFRHAISAEIDPAGEVRIVLDRSVIDYTVGSSVTVTMPPLGTVSLEPGRWSRAFAVVNPHAEIRAQLGNSREESSATIYKPTVGSDWHKPLPTDTTSPHWYDTTAFAGLVYSHINKSRHGGPDIPIGQFLRSFTGLTSTRKAKEVCQHLGLVGLHLSDLDGEDELLGVLLQTLKDLSRPPRPAALGRVPEGHYRAVFDDWYGVMPERFWFKRLVTSDATIPWVVEIAIAQTKEPGELFYAVNYSPTFDDPFARLNLKTDDLQSTGVSSFLVQLDALLPAQRTGPLLSMRSALPFPSWTRASRHWQSIQNPPWVKRLGKR